jgi:hypothetical protein
MEITKGFLLTDEDFFSLIPLIGEFSKLTNTRLVNNLREVMEGLWNERYLTVISCLDGQPKGYITGYFINDADFYVSQGYGKPPPFGVEVWGLLEEKVISLGGKKMLLHTEHSPRVFSRYGLKEERVLLSKEVG